MKRKIGWICIVLGAVCLIVAASLFGTNQYREQQASNAGATYLEKVVRTIREDADDTSQRPPSEEEYPSSSTVVPSKELPVVEIDGRLFVGYLSLPTLGIELPVLSQVDDDGLRVAPCRYTGHAASNDLVIGAHNYQSHFGRLAELSLGDEIVFVDMTGVAVRYTVADLEILDPYAVQDLTAGDYPLTLFTCTYGGATRVCVRCDRAES